ncbi:hypothetical protein BYT27DRAFT_7203520 [Phlegmacium glaucopus]|nr:hypothetical protein BYT27DRAFT_7203520 [Phlegmacium glaucopus]
MAPHHSSSDSESSGDESAPEIISLAQSKKAIQKLDAELKKAEIAERQSKRRQNRELDRKLKERADMNRAGKLKGDGADELEVRMQRAMQEAQEEMDEEGESGSGSGSEDSDSDSDSENSGEDEDDVGSIDDEQGSVRSSEEEEEEEAENLPLKPKKKTYNPDHLPDELFTAAFASSSKRKATEDEDDKPLKQTAKKAKRSHTQKDLIIGSRAIRMLPTPGRPITPSAAPSRKVKKFLNRSLALKGGKQQSKTWERRPANIGVLRRDGPASNFVRNR